MGSDFFCYENRTGASRTGLRGATGGVGAAPLGRDRAATTRAFLFQIQESKSKLVFIATSEPVIECLHGGQRLCN